MTEIASQKKSQNMFHIGVKFLCHGYVIISIFQTINMLIINNVFMCFYVIHSVLWIVLFDKQNPSRFNHVYINTFLFAK